VWRARHYLHAVYMHVMAGRFHQVPWSCPIPSTPIFSIPAAKYEKTHHIPVSGRGAFQGRRSK
jgi:hypothetical protein